MSATQLLGASSVAVLCAVLLAAAGGAQEVGGEAARLAALETELAGLERDVGLLEDTKAIKRLQRAYGYYVDKKLTREIGALFADDPDTTAELGGSGVYVGRARIAEFYDRIVGGNEAKPGELFNHMILQGVVHVAPDGRTAKGRWRALIQLGQHGESAVWAEGPYENEYVKEDGVWKIKSDQVFNTYFVPYTVGWKDVMPRPPPGITAANPPDAPPTLPFEMYPSAFLPPFHYAHPVTGQPVE